MKLFDIISESSEPKAIVGTNCANCKFVNNNSGVSVAKDDLNPQGGVKITDPKDIKLAQVADLMTMPGHKLPTHKYKCNHPKIKQYVTQKMCCAYWDTLGVLRDFKKIIDQ